MILFTFIENPEFLWLFILIIPKSLKRSFVEVERSQVFKSFKQEKDLSAVVVVAGIER
jgi:hypothetical protein